MKKTSKRYGLIPVLWEVNLVLSFQQADECICHEKEKYLLLLQ